MSEITLKTVPLYEAALSITRIHSKLSSQKRQLENLLAKKARIELEIKKIRLSLSRRVTTQKKLGQRLHEQDLLKPLQEAFPDTVALDRQCNEIVRDIELLLEKHGLPSES